MTIINPASDPHLFPREAIEKLQQRAMFAARDQRGPHTPSWGDLTDAEHVVRVCSELLMMRRELQKVHQAMFDAIQRLQRG